MQASTARNRGSSLPRTILLHTIACTSKTSQLQKDNLIQKEGSHFSKIYCMQDFRHLEPTFRGLYKQMDNL